MTVQELIVKLTGFPMDGQIWLRFNVAGTPLGYDKIEIVKDNKIETTSDVIIQPAMRRRAR